MRTFFRWLHGLRPAVRRPAILLVVYAALWPLFVLAAYGFSLAVTILILVVAAPLAHRFVGARVRQPKIGWTAKEAEERVRLARRGVLPEDERDRATLRFLLDRELKQAGVVPWGLGVTAAFLAVVVLVVLLVKDQPALAIAGSGWFVLLGGLGTSAAARQVPKEKDELRQALHRLGPT